MLSNTKRKWSKEFAVWIIIILWFRVNVWLWHVCLALLTCLTWKPKILMVLMNSPKEATATQPSGFPNFCHLFLFLPLAQAKAPFSYTTITFRRRVSPTPNLNLLPSLNLWLPSKFKIASGSEKPEMNLISSESMMKYPIISFEWNQDFPGLWCAGSVDSTMKIGLLSDDLLKWFSFAFHGFWFCFYICLFKFCFCICLLNFVFAFVYFKYRELVNGWVVCHCSIRAFWFFDRYVEEIGSNLEDWASFCLCPLEKSI